MAAVDCGVSGCARALSIFYRFGVGRISTQRVLRYPNIFWQIFVRELYAVRPDDRLIIDAGANIGAFTLYCLLRAPQAFVVAIEPADDSCARLRDLIHRHGFADRCAVHQAALSDTPGTTTLNMNAGSQFRVTGRGGVVEAVTLDAIVAPYPSVDLLKIDIEGAEYQVLPAANAAFPGRIRRIEMEYHPSGDLQQLFRCLADRGFSIETSSRSGWRVRHGEAFPAAGCSNR